MANELLHNKSLGPASPLHPWLEALPDYVPLPWLYYTEEELEAIQDPHALEECRQLSAVFDDACEVSGAARLPNQKCTLWEFWEQHTRPLPSVAIPCPAGCHQALP